MFHVIIRSLPLPDGDGGGGGGGGGATEPVTTVTESRLNPPLSNASVITCVPAPSVTGRVTVVQVCHDPVFGMLIVDQTLLGPLKPTCIEPPPFGEATRTCTV